MTLAYGLALDVGLLVPILGALDLLNDHQAVTSTPLSPARYAFFGFHLLCSLAWILGVALGVGLATAIGLGGCAVAWLVTLVWYRRNPPPVPVCAAVLLSPLSYVTAYPLLVARDQFSKIAGCIIIGINVLISASVLILIEAVRLHDAWGCYPPSTPMSGWDEGLCGTSGFWYPPLAPICRRLPAGCLGEKQLEPFQFFGDAFAVAVHAGMFGITVWIAAGATLLLARPRVSADKPDAPPPPPYAISFLL